MQYNDITWILRYTLAGMQHVSRLSSTANKATVLQHAKWTLDALPIKPYTIDSLEPVPPEKNTPEFWRNEELRAMQSHPDHTNIKVRVAMANLEQNASQPPTPQGTVTLTTAE